MGILDGTASMIGAITNLSRGRQYYKGMAEDQAGIDYKYNQMAADEDAARNYRYWQKTFNATNAYNSPAAMRRRLEQAGLSKASMFEGTIGAPSDGGEVLGGSSGFNPRAQIQGSDINAFAENIRAGALTAAQIRNLDAQSALYDEESTSEGVRRSLMDTTNDLQRMNIDISGLDKIARQIENEFNKQSYDNRLTLEGLNIAESMQNLDSAREDIIEKKRNNRIGDEFQERLVYSAYLKTCAEIAYIKAQQEYTKTHGELTKEQQKVAAAMFELYTSEAHINKMISEGFDIQYGDEKVHIHSLIQSQAISEYGRSRDLLEHGLHSGFNFYYDTFTGIWKFAK